MHGKVVAFDTDTFRGVINAHDGQRYAFVMQEWRGTGAPITGQEVDFQIDGAHAKDIVPVVLSVPQADVPRSAHPEYLSFSGRTSRKTFWMRFVLPFWAVLFGCAFIDRQLAFFDPDTGAPIFPVAALALLASLWPWLATSVRRCHDRGRSGWVLLAVLIPVVGAVWLFIELYLLPGERGDNRFGTDPLTIGA